MNTSDRTRAPHYYSEAAILHALEDALQALHYSRAGMRPFSFSYYFDDGHNGDKTGPVEGVVWARDREDAMRHIARNAHGTVYGYDILCSAMDWQA